MMENHLSRIFLMDVCGSVGRWVVGRMFVRVHVTFALNNFKQYTATATHKSFTRIECPLHPRMACGSFCIVILNGRMQPTIDVSLLCVRVYNVHSPE